MPIQIPSNHQTIPNILQRVALEAPKQNRPASHLLPLYEADIARESYRVAIFDETSLSIEDFAREYGAESKRASSKLSNFVEIPVTRYTIEASVDRGETEGSHNLMQSSLILREERLLHAYNKLMNSIEARQIQLILNKTAYANHVLVPVDGEFWNDSTSDPVQDIFDAKDLIKSKIGFSPNTMIISEPVWKVLRLKPELLQLLPDTTLKAGLAPETFAKIIGVETVIIAEKMIHDGTGLVYAWGENTVLAYVPKTLFTLDEPSFGITVRAPLGYHSMREYFDEKTTSDITAIDEKLGNYILIYPKNTSHLFCEVFLLIKNNKARY
ncbi:MAG: hypothetical protein ACRCTJ_02220 [Brevinema sp.]